jgi:asparagine synthase (glutamine-hydrolysing)
MCGIIGFIDFNKRSKEVDLTRMIATLNHRGPDDFGAQLREFSDCTVGLAQARLSIIDLSTGGHQPMNFEEFSIVFNGEIYNYKEIKLELSKLGHLFVSESDTEMILHAYQEWGVNCVDRFIGMFAIAIYDAVIDKLILIRDRAGVKPLYVYWDQKILLFSSELKAFHEHPDFEKEIDKEGLFKYMQLGYIPTPNSIFKNVYKVKAGSYEIWDLTNKKRSETTYWDVRTFYKLPKLEIPYEEAKKQLHSLLKSAFNYRMVSDVPVGVFLSGGYDSTAVAAILQSTSTERLKTFTIGFEEGNNEAPFAKETAELLGTDHTEYICTTKEAQEIIPDLPYFYDEPFGDSSAIPTILVSRMAKEKVTVALSADGGDEVFGGYGRYDVLEEHTGKLEKIPFSLRNVVASMSGIVRSVVRNSSLNHKLAGVEFGLDKDDEKQMANLYLEMVQTPRIVLENCFDSVMKKEFTQNIIHPEGFSHKMDPILAWDYKMYLQDDILAKVDRAAMSVSLEGREPLVDHRIVEFAARLPMEYKRHLGTGKRILKDIVHEYIPKKVLDRPKAGFSLPIYDWLRGDLSYLIDDYLNEEALKLSGIWDVKYCLNQVILFKKRKLHYSPFIWYLLMFQMWYKKWG